MSEMARSEPAPRSESSCMSRSFALLLEWAQERGIVKEKGEVKDAKPTF